MLFDEFCNTDLYVKVAVEHTLLIASYSLGTSNTETITNLLTMLSPDYLHHLSVELLH